MTSKKKTKKDKKLAYREQDFKAYVEWKSLPSMFYGKDEMTLRALGIMDEETIKLLGIRTQTQFAERYNISQPAILTRWNIKIRENHLIPDEREFFKDKAQNVLAALYKNAMVHGSASEAKLFFQYVKEWREKTEQGLPEKELEMLEDLTNTFKKMMTNDNSTSQGHSKNPVQI